MTEIRGLYQPGVDDRAVRPAGTTRGAGYSPGYTSADDRGRIYINRTPDGTWTKNTQYIEITVTIDPPSVTIPPGSKVTWSFEDPDDPTNQSPAVHVDAGKLLDPNDYTGTTLNGPIANDNDPRGKKQESARFEQTEARYALSGNDTLIDIPTRLSKVRFHVSDVAGDNWRVRATINPLAPITTVTPAATGIMTAWNRIDLEYVKMSSATELPVDQIALHYDIACAQVDVSLKRVVTGAADMASMGADDGAAGSACDTYASSAGQFTMAGQKGWFFVVAANRFVPASSATILYEGNAQAFGDRVRLPASATLPSGSTAAVVRVFNSAAIVGLTAPMPNDRSKHIKFRVSSRSGRNITIVPHDFHLPEDPDNSFLDADLSHYGFASGATIYVQVLSRGDDALVTGGISPGGADVAGHHYFGGRLLVFTQSAPTADYIRTLCHELCHAFDNAHKCGNWDYKNQPARTACCMCYWFQFVLDDASPRAPIPWTQDRTNADLCGPHIVRMRDYHLEDNPGLGWGTP